MRSSDETQADIFAKQSHNEADVLHGAVHGGHMMPFALDLAILAAFCVFLFAASLWNIQRRWIL